MKMPKHPPQWELLLRNQLEEDRLTQLLVRRPEIRSEEKYLHWDKLRHLTPPAELSHEEWWLLLKLGRQEGIRQVGLRDRKGVPFQFAMPDLIVEDLHQIDLGAGGSVGMPEQITNPQTRNRYLIRSLMEEAITSSQLEGAVTTREVAKEMIRTGRKPRDVSEQMILNNYRTMQKIRTLKEEPLSRDLVFQIHRMVTDKTLDDPTAAGRFRRPDEKRVVGDDYGEIFHDPPAADELERRMEAMCDFANAKTPDYFVHPVIRAILLHFWLAYDHPFYDGNGRTARALFYWSMLKSGYWLFEFISISNILTRSPSKYYRSFLYTETDDNDMTYFVVAQMKVIRQAIQALHDYIKQKTAEVREVESQMRALDLFNHRQVALIRHALKNPGRRYTFNSHKTSHNISYQTARTDLLGLKEREILEEKSTGKPIHFIAPSDLSNRLLRLNEETQIEF